MICPSCGSNQPDGQAFCDQCGAKLSAPMPQPAPVSPVYAPPVAVAAGPTPMPVAGGATCTACGHVNPPGGNFCENCGTSIGASPPLVVTPPPSGPLPRFTLPNNQVIGFKPGQTSWMIGREDPMSGVHPDVDLTAYDPELTASRKHAVIAMNGGQAVLTSLTTVNWTRVNGNRLTPNQPVPLNNGDRIEFAKVMVTFSLA